MRELNRVSCLVAGLFVAVGIAEARQGTIKGLTLSPTQGGLGTTVSATTTGSSPCGAVHINWGDGAAITYATDTLPVTQTHIYQTGGAFTVRAQGMGNCVGEATAQVTIKGPPAAPPAPTLSAVELTPAFAPPRTPVAIALQGSGSCRLTLDFGDGNRQDLNGALPLTVRHTYALPGAYTIVATPAAPCAERRTATLEVGRRQASRITGIEVASPPGAPAGLRSIHVAGIGPCTYLVDYGDGNSESRTASLPEVIQHNYPADGRYTIVTTPTPPCSGVLRSTIVVGRAGRDLRGNISRVDVSPQVARLGQPVTVTVAGTGTCRFTVDFHDGESRSLTEPLPHRLTYRYAEPGDYEIVVWTDEPCTGQGEAVLRIRRR